MRVSRNRSAEILPRSELALAAVILAFYFFARYAVFERLDEKAWWSSYVFEIVFAGAVGLYYRSRVTFRFEPERLFFKHAGAMLGAGAAIAAGIGLAGIPNPFPVGDGRTVFLMLNVAPVVEEAVFRMALWIPMGFLLFQRNPFVLLAVNAAVFSGAHLVSLTVAPEAYVPFVLVQSLYVIGLAGVCGWWMLRTGSLIHAIFIHYSFNLGFYLSSLLF